MARNGFNYSAPRREDWEGSMETWEPIRDSTTALVQGATGRKTWEPISDETTSKVLDSMGLPRMDAKAAFPASSVVVGNTRPGMNVEPPAEKGPAVLYGDMSPGAMPGEDENNGLARGTFRLYGDTARAYERNRVRNEREQMRRSAVQAPPFRFNSSTPAKDLRARYVMDHPASASPVERAQAEAHLNAKAAEEAEARSRFNSGREEAAEASARRDKAIDDYIGGVMASPYRFISRDDSEKYMENYAKLRGADKTFYDELMAILPRNDGGNSIDRETNELKIPSSWLKIAPDLGKSLNRLTALANASVVRGDGRMFRYAMRQYQALKDGMARRGIDITTRGVL